MPGSSWVSAFTSKPTYTSAPGEATREQVGGEKAPRRDHSPTSSPRVERGHFTFDPWDPPTPKTRTKPRHLAYGAVTLAFLLLISSLASYNSQTGRATGGPSDLATEGSENRTLVLYAFHETEDALDNLRFFLKHGLHASADFKLLVNGPTTFTDFPTSLPNVQVIKRPNKCYDMGGYGEVLNSNGGALVRQYTKFILLNASVRGPFMPHWSKQCWSTAYTDKVTSHNKLVGMSANCHPAHPPHIQSMIFATDQIGIKVLLDERNTYSLSSCPNAYDDAVQVEIHATGHIRDAGYGVDVMMQEFQSSQDGSYWDSCSHDDFVALEGTYFGGNVHPYETLFTKTKRGVSGELVGKLTEWTDKSGYSSFDYC